MSGILIPRTREIVHTTDGLPNSTLTPGDTTSDDQTTVMNPGFAQSRRQVPKWLKAKVFDRYGIPNADWPNYDIDHLVPLSLGGTNGLNNLWPHPWSVTYNPRRKAQLEQLFRRRVRQNQITLEVAQRLLMTNWIEAYQQLI